MGRKVNPIGFRLAVRRDWRSRWYAKGRDFAAIVIKDAEMRRHVEKTYPQANISLVEIERTSSHVHVIIHSGRPGVLIGKKGEGIDQLRVKLRKISEMKDVLVDVKEVSQPDANAKLIALNIASQLERRIMFRRAMRRAMAGAMRLGVEGVKIMCAGRLNGIEIARTEWYREGRVPLHTLKNDVDYGVAEAKTNMGVVGIKVWVSRGENVAHKQQKYSAATGGETPAAETETTDDAASSETKPEAKSGVKIITDNTDVKAAEVEAEDMAEIETVKPKSAAAKKPAAKKPAAKKAAAKKKPAAKKPAAKKPAVKKSAAKKPAAKKPVVKKAATKTAAKKSTARKTKTTDKAEE